MQMTDLQQQIKVIEKNVKFVKFIRFVIGNQNLDEFLRPSRIL
jgi:hypothetical protein